MAGSNTSHSATIFSDPTPPRFAAPRPPTPIIAMLSLSLRFRARRNAGAASVPTADPASAFVNCRRVTRDVDRPFEEAS